MLTRIFLAGMFLCFVPFPLLAADLPTEHEAPFQRLKFGEQGFQPDKITGVEIGGLGPCYKFNPQELGPLATPTPSHMLSINNDPTADADILGDGFNPAGLLKSAPKLMTYYGPGGEHYGQLKTCLYGHVGDAICEGTEAWKKHKIKLIKRDPAVIKSVIQEMKQKFLPFLALFPGGELIYRTYLVPSVAGIINDFYLHPQILTSAIFSETVLPNAEVKPFTLSQLNQNIYLYKSRFPMTKYCNQQFSGGLGLHATIFQALELKDFEATLVNVRPYGVMLNPEQISQKKIPLNVKSGGWYMEYKGKIPDPRN